MDLKQVKENLLTKLNADTKALNNALSADNSKELLYNIGTESMILEKLTDMEMKYRRIAEIEKKEEAEKTISNLKIAYDRKHGEPAEVKHE